MEAVHAAHGDLGGDMAALALHALAGILEKARLRRLTRNQHILFRLGELISYAEGAASLVRRARRAAGGDLNPKADRRIDPAALASMSRVFAREAALKVASQGMGWISGAANMDDSEMAAFEQAISFTQVYRGQAGMIADMDRAADFLYGRSASG